MTTAGVACGSLAWWLVLVTAAAALRERVGERSPLWVNRVSGAAIAVLGVVAAWAGLATLAGRGEPLGGLCRRQSGRCGRMGEGSRDCERR